MSNFKPLLAYTIEDTSTIKYPALCSMKLDGIRMVVIDGVCYSRSMKPIRSKAVQELFGKPEFEGYDGELLYGPWNAENVFNVTTTAVMGTELKEGWDKSLITFAIFDNVRMSGTFQERLEKIRSHIWNGLGQARLVPQVVIKSEEELLQFEKEHLEEGFEGIMVRSIDGRYKQGRSTAKEGIIGKLKRMSQDEGLIVGFEEKMTNTNEAKKNELGRTQRSQAQDGMVGADTLGAFILESQGIRFTCGSGLDDAMRKEVWNNKEKYIGKYVTFTHFAIGRVDSFRFPIFKGFRDVEDM